jgi:hypothetical protein
MVLLNSLVIARRTGWLFLAAACFTQTAQAQLVGGLELGLNSIKLSDKDNSNPVFGRDRGVINGARFFFGAQRNWTSVGWIADFDYQTGNTDHVGQSAQGYAIATSGQVRAVSIGATLNWPFAKFDAGSLALAPRLGYRNVVRQVDSTANLAGNFEDYQEGIAALGFLVHGQFERGFGVSAKFEIERPFAARQATQLTAPNGPQINLLSNPSGLWRPQIELSAWYRINPRHSITLKARTQDFSTGDSERFEQGSINPANLTTLPGQKIRMNSLRAAWAYHF